MARRYEAHGLYDEKEVLAKVWKKSIEQITTDDGVLSYDKDGNLSPCKAEEYNGLLS